MQNIHRYFLYLALLFIVVLHLRRVEGDVVPAPATATSTFGIGVGTLVLAVNIVLLASYTFGCHSLRHLVGGRKDEISKTPLCAGATTLRDALNGTHMLFAWISLFSVGFADLYVRLCSMGIWRDFRIL